MYLAVSHTIYVRTSGTIRSLKLKYVEQGSNLGLSGWKSNDLTKNEYEKTKRRL